MKIHRDAFPRAHRAWAVVDDWVDVDGKRYRSLAGHGFWQGERPAHLSGYVSATFATRAQARAECKRMNAVRKWMSKARFAPVRILIRITPA